MKTIAIKNLNKVIVSRNKMIDDIIYYKHNPKTDKAWDKLEERYKNKSYSYLEKQYNNLIKN